MFSNAPAGKQDVPSELIDCHGLLHSKLSGPSALSQEKSAQTTQKKQPNLMLAKTYFTRS